MTMAARRTSAWWCSVALCCWLAGVISPIHPAPIKSAVDDSLNSGALDPVQWKEAIGEDVYRAKRKYRPEEWAAANAILDLLEQLRAVRNPTLASRTLATATTTTAKTTTEKKTTTTTTTTPAPPAARAVEGEQKPRTDRSSQRREDDEVPQFNPDGTIMLQLPGKLFGNATNFVLAAAKLFGDFITNTAIRTARFMQLFQPIAGRHLFIQIPTPSPSGVD